MFHRSLAVLMTPLLMLFPLSTTANAQDANAIIAENAQAITLRADRVRGPGASTLRAEIKAASFLCVGEFHGNSQTPQLLTALIPTLRNAGYEAFAIEVGHTEAQYMQSGLKDDPESLAKSFSTIPFSIPFFDRVPEFELAKAAVDADMQLWGLDQVFLGGARLNLKLLTDLATNDDSRAAVDKANQRAWKGFREFATQGDGSNGFLVATTSSQYRALRNAFEDNAPAQLIIDELQRSAEIYRLYREGANYESNHTRIELMKDHLDQQLASLDPDAKVLMKFGTVHMGRGYSPLNQLDLGNAAAELARARGSHSLHLIIASADANHEPMRTLAKASDIPDDEYRLIDLRPLRPFMHNDSNARRHPELAELTWSYDMVILVPSFTSAERLPGVPEAPGS